MSKTRKGGRVILCTGCAFLRALTAFMALILNALPISASAEDRHLRVEVAEPYLELHVGPGEAYSVFHVVARGEKIEVLKQRTGWFKIRTEKNVEGWVPRARLEQTLVAPGEKFSVREASQENFVGRNWEAGVLTGNFEGSNLISLYTGYAFNPNLSAELSLAQILGDFSDSLMFNFDLVAQPFDDWRASPFFLLGTGVIDTHARKTVVASNDSRDQISHVGVGFKVYMGRRFIFRAEYRNSVIFAQSDDNKEIDEWRAGFAFFY
ncbi:MAG: SH3 domain-containing protein [Gammaproteobacteria bacterium]|nr:SH3 domain-containing protein [Gammaproteobacteria bacterium]